HPRCKHLLLSQLHLLAERESHRMASNRVNAPNEDWFFVLPASFPAARESRAGRYCRARSRRVAYRALAQQVKRHL
ncbi:MAG: hypothetical protein WD229_10680, partial [Pirellulales bacterium]